jgi:hypothetical protein
VKEARVTKWTLLCVVAAGAVLIVIRELILVRDATLVSRNAIVASCVSAVKWGSLVVLDEIRRGVTIENAWEDAGPQLLELQEDLSRSGVTCPCWRSRWAINPAAREWTDVDIEGDPLLAVAAFSIRAGDEPVVIFVTAQGGTVVHSLEDLPEWASSISIETLD